MLYARLQRKECRLSSVVNLTFCVYNTKFSARREIRLHCKKSSWRGKQNKNYAFPCTCASLLVLYCGDFFFLPLFFCQPCDCTYCYSRLTIVFYRASICSAQQGLTRRSLLLTRPRKPFEISGDLNWWFGKIFRHWNALRLKHTRFLWCCLLRSWFGKNFRDWNADTLNAQTLEVFVLLFTAHCLRVLCTTWCIISGNSYNTLDAGCGVSATRVYYTTSPKYDVGKQKLQTVQHRSIASLGKNENTYVCTK